VINANLVIAGIANASSALDRNCVYLYQRQTGNTVAFQSADGSGVNQASATTTIKAGEWYHAAGVLTSSSSRSAFLNGGGKATETSTRVPSGMNRSSIGVQDQATASTPFNGAIAEVAFWNVALTDQEIAVLATGMPASAVRPQSLVFYLPLVRELIDVMGNAPFAKVGAPAAAEHCRIYGPCA
jgi:hypothetical protein